MTFETVSAVGALALPSAADASFVWGWAGAWGAIGVAAFFTAVLTGLVLGLQSTLLSIGGPSRDDTADPGREDER